MTRFGGGSRSSVAAFVLAFALAAVAPRSLHAQVGQGLLDPNTATEAELLTLPHFTPPLVKALLERRPFGSALELDAFLKERGLAAAQLDELYAKAFVHVNLNTASSEEIQLIPRAGRRMAHEFQEYRPWKSWAQFDKEIGKYVDQAEVARLKQYAFIPVKLNTATDEDLRSIPGVGNRMLHELKEYRPWKTQPQFEKEIGKYVGPKEVARLWRYVVID
jgi:DNA uptake protein ComE-like DNA-binding protein